MAITKTAKYDAAYLRMAAEWSKLKEKGKGNKRNKKAAEK